MTTSSNVSATASAARGALRLRLGRAAATGIDGAWWPRSRDLQVEAVDLVDHFPEAVGRVNRLLFSRPDWDNATVQGQSVRRIRAARGPVKIGSFPHDDTRLMVVVLASGQRLKLAVIPSATDRAEAERRLDSTAAASTPDDGDGAWALRDDESLGG